MRLPGNAWLPICLSVALLGCSDADGDDTNGTTANTAGQGGAAVATGVGASGVGGQGVGGNVAASCMDANYPAGPYGNQLGDVVPNLLLRGYVNDDAVGIASAQPFVDYTFDDVRKTCKGYAVVHVSDYT